MSDHSDDKEPKSSGGCPFHAGASRRGFLGAVGGFAAALGASATARAESSDSDQHDHRDRHGRHGIEPFYGAHQSGIATPQQNHTYFAAFDLATMKRDELVGMLKSWTDAAARMTLGKTAKEFALDNGTPPNDSGDALDLPPSRLTLTFGFGPGMFTKDGKDRYGLAAHRPEALVDLPKFNGDQLIESKTGGDLSVQACSDDPQVAMHAVRQLGRLAYGAANLRWVQEGFLSQPQNGGTARNLMGFKDGTQRPKELEKVVWVGGEGPDWMRGGSYQVVRRIRISLEHWDRTELDFQEQVIGRYKYTGAPIGGKHEFEPPDFEANDADGNPVIGENAHLRLATASSNGGAQILRRGYSYSDGAIFTAERWPPWRQGMEYDAGLFFVAYQKDPRTGFIKIFDKMSKLDMLNQFTTHTGSGLFACPKGTSPGTYIGQTLFEATS